MKKSAIATALIAVLILALPYVIGRVAETATEQLSHQINQNPEDYGELLLERYDRGYRHTNSELRWTVPAQYHAILGESVRLTCTGHHKLFKYQKRCAPNRVKNTDLSTALPVKFLLTRPLLGDLSVLVQFDAIEKTFGNNTSIALGEGQIEIRPASSATRFDVEGRFSDFIRRDLKGETQTLAPVILSGNVDFVHSPLLMGRVKLEGELLSTKELIREKNEGARSKAIVMVHATEIDRSLNIGASLSLAEAPEFDEKLPAVHDLSFNSRFKGMKVRQIREFLLQLQEVEYLESLPISDERRSGIAALRLQLIPNLLDLFDQGVESVSHLSFLVNEKETNFKSSISLRHDLSFSDFVLLSVQPEQVLSKFVFNLSSQIPNHEFTRYQRTDVGLLKLYESDGDFHKLEINNASRGVTLNGETISLNDLMERFRALGETNPPLETRGG